MRETPAPKVDKPATDISIPITIEKVKLPDSIDPKGWRGTHILIPVTIHGNKYRFIFDTGAGTSYMSEQFARKVGVRIVNDSLISIKNQKVLRGVRWERWIVCRLAI